MIWFLGIMGVIIVLMFIGLCMVDVINKKKKADPKFAAKVEKILEKTDPFFTFCENLIGWVLVVWFIYYIALG